MSFGTFDEWLEHITARDSAVRTEHLQREQLQALYNTLVEMEAGNPNTLRRVQQQLDAKFEEIKKAYAEKK